MDLAVSTAYTKGMGIHSYSRCWIHLIWGTLKRERILTREAAARVSSYLSEYAESKKIYMKINFVNPDHVHVLIDLPTNLPLDEIIQMLKGSSSHWINANDLVTDKFAWGRGYGVFSVSESKVKNVAKYIAGQEEHHKIASFSDEFARFVTRHGLQLRDEESR